MSSDKQDRRTAILEAAAQLFGQQGFEGTSMKAVAVAAGEQKSLVQYHFPYKQQLWEETVSYVWQQRDTALPTFLTTPPDDLSPRETMEALCRAILKFTFANPTWVKIMFQEASTPGPRLQWMAERFFHDDFAQGKDVVELAQSQGLLPKVDTLHLLYTLSGALIYLVNVEPIIERVTGDKPSEEEFIDRYAESLLEIFSGASIDD